MRMRGSRWSALLVGLVVVLAAGPAWAVFHFMKVVEVFPGTPAQPQAQYVVLQMYMAGQNQVQTHQVILYDASGAQSGIATFSTAVGSGANQRKILIATTQA